MIMEQQKRATFEDVCKAQDTLIDLIDECIKKNKPLTPRDRKKFINTFRLATLGLGSEHIFYIKGKNKGYNIGHVGHAAYWLSYRTDAIITLNKDVFEIRDFWLKLRDYCFNIFSHAQEMSIKISKEIVDMYQGNTSSYDYDDL
jgi:hypothetical protein